MMNRRPTPRAALLLGLPDQTYYPAGAFAKHFLGNLNDLLFHVGG